MNLVNSKLNNIILKYLFLLFLFISTLSYPQKTFPMMTMSDISGEKINLNQLSANNILLISFWATWCNPCIDELETFNAIKNDLNILYNTKYIAISIDDSRSYSRVIPLVKGKGWDFIVAVDINQKLKRLLNISTIPHTVLVYKNKIIYEHTGFVKGDEDLIIKKLKVFIEQ